MHWLSTVCDVPENKPWRDALGQNIKASAVKTIVYKPKQFAKRLTVKRPRNLVLELVDAATNRVTANTTITIIMSSVCRVGLDTMYDKA